MCPVVSCCVSIYTNKDFYRDTGISLDLGVQERRRNFRIINLCFEESRRHVLLVI